LLQVVDRLRSGAVIIYPTDSAYALGCHLGYKAALDRIRAIRRLDEKHNFTLVCRDLSELSTYALVDNASFRLLRNHTPGPYTFILKATAEVPRRLMHPRRKTIGMRVPDNAIVLALLELLDEPLMSVTLTLPGDELPLTDAEEMQQRLGHHEAVGQQPVDAWDGRGAGQAQVAHLHRRRPLAEDGGSRAAGQPLQVDQHVDAGLCDQARRGEVAPGVLEQPERRLEHPERGPQRGGRRHQAQKSALSRPPVLRSARALT